MCIKTYNRKIVRVKLSMINPKLSSLNPLRLRRPKKTDRVLEEEEDNKVSLNSLKISEIVEHGN